MTLVAVVVGFENAQMRRRTQKVKEAGSYLRVPGYTIDEQRCAACEAVAQSIEGRMKNDAHKGGYVEQVALLMSACDRIDETVHPSELKMPAGSGQETLPEEKKVLQFAKMHLDGDKQTVSVGLGEFCTTLVEEFEDELVEMIASAKSINSPIAKEMTGSDHAYELKEQTCVHVTKSCTSEGLNQITAARLGQLSNLPKEQRDKLMKMLERKYSKGEAGSAPKAAAPQEKAVPKPSPDATGKKWKGKTKSSKPPPAQSGLPANPVEAFEWLYSATTKKPYAVLASVTATTALVYIGGMVARLW